MHAWKAEFLFFQAPNEAVAGCYRYSSRPPTNSGRMTSYLELEDNLVEKQMEYFQIAEYSTPNNSSFVGPSNWIPFKEMFYDDNFLVAAGLRQDGDRGILLDFSRVMASCNDCNLLTILCSCGQNRLEKILDRRHKHV